MIYYDWFYFDDWNVRDWFCGRCSVTSVDDVVLMAPVDGFDQLVDVDPDLLRQSSVRHVLQQLQHVLQHTHTHTHNHQENSDRTSRLHLTFSMYSNTRYSFPRCRNASFSSTMFSCFSVRSIFSSRMVVSFTSSFSESQEVNTHYFLYFIFKQKYNKQRRN